MTTIDRRGFARLAGLGAAGSLVGAAAAPARAAAAPLPLAAPSPAAAAPSWDTCLSVARDLLLVGEDGSDLKLKYLRVLIDQGLPRTRTPKKVLVIGAGIAGLAAAALLERAGHHVTVIEANGNRVGGRIKTFQTGFADPRQYAEAGAMRIPDFHPLTLALIDKLGIPRRPFYNVDVRPGAVPRGPVPPVVYTSRGGRVWRSGPGRGAFTPPERLDHTWIHVNGISQRRAQYAADPRRINASFGLRDRRTAGRILDEALDPVRDHFSVVRGGRRVDKPLPELVKGWARVLREFDGYSMRRFLSEHAGLGEAAIDAVGTLENLTSRLPLAFMHTFLTRSLVNPSATYWELAGGSHLLPERLAASLREKVRLDRRAVRISSSGGGVRVETVSEKGSDESSSAPQRTAETFHGDVAIVTIPFPALRHVEITPAPSYAKRRAIMELHYDSATKVLLEFRRRWWEFDEDDWRRELGPRYRPGPVTHVTGGGSVADNANRFTYYPSHPVPGSQGGVVLASYVWADDAARWDSMDDDERYAYALRGLREVHGDRVAEFYTGHGRTQSWLRNRYAFGEAAVFLPGQMTEIHPAIPVPEGPLHFAGEHTSLKHAWIEGSLESAVRAALEVNA
ncbi:amine oxidase [Sphaerisporangium melleum]|uniref:Amine oxidase n=1 Tax=Sphaerisporangium melleum TaxID=321316 RepID=A0A917R412_9ACTN|nr:NAD(P)/FAD-dependent oxidoreductase [Sphaerisporangium melleum]GGK89351.1 amine oxidase [Sphaerisporangium melleum]GII72486.1 amine oxidase [Sphaerisporangium melleum]